MAGGESGSSTLYLTAPGESRFEGSACRMEWIVVTAPEQARDACVGMRGAPAASLRSAGLEEWIVMCAIAHDGLASATPEFDSPKNKNPAR